MTAMTDEKSTILEELESLKKSVAEKQEKLADNATILRKQEEDPNIGKLRKLVETTEKIKSAETEFRENVRAELEIMKARNESVRQLIKASTAQESEDSADDLKKLAKLKMELSKLSRENMELERTLDSVPMKAELSQYQKRFLELNQQISTKHTETQNFYDMFNNLGDQKFYIEKEISLLNTLQENLAGCTTGQINKYALLRTIEELLTGVKGAKERVEEKLTQQLAVKSTHLKEKARLNGERETFYSLLQQIQKEMNNMDILARKMEVLRESG